MRDAPAGERDAMQFTCAVGGFDSIQPRTCGGAGEFVGGGEGKEFNVFHERGFSTMGLK